MNLTKEEKTVRNILINVASKKQLIYYSDLCKTANLRLDMSIPADRGKIGEILGHISRYEHENGRPLISSVVNRCILSIICHAFKNGVYPNVCTIVFILSTWFNTPIFHKVQHVPFCFYSDFFLR